MYREALSEGLGTFFLVIIGCGAIIVSRLYPESMTHLGVAMCFGLAVLVMIYTFGDVSGAHLNPAVTLGFLCSGRFPSSRVFGYISCQFMGAMAGALVLKVLFPGADSLGSTHPSGTVIQSLLLEFLLTFLLIFVVLSVSQGSSEKGITAGIAVGSVITMEALFGGPISGASMNPARSFAPAIVSGQFMDLWIYFIGPISGSLFASLIHTNVMRQSEVNFSDTTQVPVDSTP